MLPTTEPVLHIDSRFFLPVRDRCLTKGQPNLMTRQELIRAVGTRYRTTTQGQKTEILNEFVQLTHDPQKIEKIGVKDLITGFSDQIT